MVVRFDGGANQTIKGNYNVEDYRQDHQTQTGLLNLAGELGNGSRACQVMGMSRETLYRYRSAGR